MGEKDQGKHQSLLNHLNIYFFDNTEDMRLYEKYNFFDERSVFRDNLYYSLNPEDEFKVPWVYKESKSSSYLQGMFPPDDLPFSALPPSEGNRWADPLFLEPEAHDYQLSISLVLGSFFFFSSSLSPGSVNLQLVPVDYGASWILHHFNPMFLL